MFYSAFDGKNVRVCYATSPDLINFKKQGIISPAQVLYDEATEIFKRQGLKEEYILGKSYCEAIGGKGIFLWDKDAFIFPRRINGKIAFIHRILPDIQIAYADKFEDFNEKYWNDYLLHIKEHVILEPKFVFEGRSIGGGCPPIETEDGWLFIYHGTENTADGTMYHTLAALLDRENPQKVLGKLSYPLFSPEEPWEKVGYINNVVFPTGTILKGDRLIIYYGAADKLVAAKSLNLRELLSELKKS